MGSQLVRKWGPKQYIFHLDFILLSIILHTLSPVIAVLIGCLAVLLKANKSSKEPIFDEEVKGEAQLRMVERKKRASVILYSQVNSVAPNVTATAAFKRQSKEQYHRGSLPPKLVRSLQLGDDERNEIEDDTDYRKSLKKTFTSPRDELRRLSQILMKGYGSTMDIVGEEV